MDPGSPAVSPIRVAVIGGKIGAQHIEAYRALPDLYDMRVLCDLNLDTAGEVARAYGVPETTASFDEVLRRDDIELVDICTPSGIHFAQTAAALRAGKHVVCEKPLAGSLAEVDELAALERETGRRLCPIFQYRFGHGLEKFLHLKNKGVLGKSYVATIETHWKRGQVYYDNPWRGRWATELGGTLITHAIHAHDMLVVALGPIATVFARTATRVNRIETEDCAALTLEMADGTLVSISVTMGSAVEISRLRFCFEHATIESNYAPYKPHLEPWQIMAMDGAAQSAIEAALADFQPQLEHFQGQFSRLHAALAGQGPSPVTTADSRVSLELATAAYHSARTDTLVKLPIGADHPLYRGWRP